MSGLRIWASGLRVWGSGLRLSYKNLKSPTYAKMGGPVTYLSVGLRVQGLGFRAEGVGPRVGLAPWRSNSRV